MSSTTRASARRSVARLLAVGLLITVLASCRPMNNSESILFVKTNDFRAAHGLAPLAQQEQLLAQARSWAGAMAAREQISHSDPNQWNVGWTAVAENVGVSGSIQDIVNRLEQSPDHVANMLSTKYTHLAVGAVRGKDGRIYAVQLFWRG